MEWKEDKSLGCNPKHKPEDNQLYSAKEGELRHKT